MDCSFRSCACRVAEGLGCTKVAAIQTPGGVAFVDLLKLHHDLPLPCAVVHSAFPKRRRCMAVAVIETVLWVYAPPPQAYAMKGFRRLFQACFRWSCGANFSMWGTLCLPLPVMTWDSDLPPSWTRRWHCFLGLRQHNRSQLNDASNHGGQRFRTADLHPYSPVIGFLCGCSVSNCLCMPPETNLPLWFRRQPICCNLDSEGSGIRLHGRLAVIHLGACGSLVFFCFFMLFSHWVIQKLKRKLRLC
mmetsp:Transcript_58261/g.103964  ORF Transcript_58261/g.103964 Transcript_58261/m.103964 type:complete len:246 (-) Transcript_58261:4544-5281(-)